MERGKLHKATAGTGTATISSFHCGPGKFKLPVRPGQEFKADKKLLKPYLCYSFIHFKGRCIFVFFLGIVSGSFISQDKKRKVPIISVAAS